jgi:hypothetical protein
LLSEGVVDSHVRPTLPLPRRAVDCLFRRFAVEVLVVGLRVIAGMVDDAVPMIRRRIERIELQWNIPRLAFGY